VEQLRERLGSELRRYLAPVTLPTPFARNEDESDDVNSPLRNDGQQRKSEPGGGSESRP
jgi:hypothetical protein